VKPLIAEITATQYGRQEYLFLSAALMTSHNKAAVCGLVMVSQPITAVMSADVLVVKNLMPRC